MYTYDIQHDLPCTIRAPGSAPKPPDPRKAPARPVAAAAEAQARNLPLGLQRCAGLWGHAVDGEDGENRE